jgi:Flp pilus assembly protein TadG
MPTLLRSRRIPAPRGAGQSLVEFALVLPVIVLIVFGTIDVGRAIFTYNTLSESARQADRVAIVDQDGANITDAAIGYAPTLGLTSADVTVCYTGETSTALDCSSAPPCEPMRVGCLAIVTVDLAYVPLTPIISDIIGSIPLSSTSIAPVESLCESGCP